MDTYKSICNKFGIIDFWSTEKKKQFYYILTYIQKQNPIAISIIIYTCDILENENLYLIFCFIILRMGYALERVPPFRQYIIYSSQNVFISLWVLMKQNNIFLYLSEFGSALYIVYCKIMYSGGDDPFAVAAHEKSKYKKILRFFFRARTQLTYICVRRMKKGGGVLHGTETPKESCAIKFIPQINELRLLYWVNRIKCVFAFRICVSFFTNIFHERTKVKLQFIFLPCVCCCAFAKMI